MRTYRAGGIVNYLICVCSSEPHNVTGDYDVLEFVDRFTEGHNEIRFKIVTKGLLSEQKRPLACRKR